MPAAAAAAESYVPFIVRTVGAAFAVAAAATHNIDNNDIFILSLISLFTLTCCVLYHNFVYTQNTFLFFYTLLELVPQTQRERIIDDKSDLGFQCF